MHASPPEPGYFETPERQERLRLVAHLIANARELAYLRAPAGAGKTLFVRRLMADMADDYNFVWLDAAQEQDLAAVSARQLDVGDVDDEAAPGWPDNLLFAMAERELLVVVDNADLLEAPTMRQLIALNERGASVLLAGRGGLVANSGWAPRVIDLPGFTAEQSAAFLRSRGGPGMARVTDEMAVALHGAAHGLPGPLLEGLAALESRARAPADDTARVRSGSAEPPVAVKSAASGPPAIRALVDRVTASLRANLLPRPWLLAGAAALAVLLLVTLVFQDTLNSWVDGEVPVTADSPPAVDTPLQSTRQSPPTVAPTGGPADPGTAVPESAEPASGHAEPTDTVDVPPVVEPPTQEPASASEPVVTGGAGTPPAVDGAAAEAVPEPLRDEDPLAAVMRDALAAAEADPGTTQPVPGVTASDETLPPVPEIPAPAAARPTPPSDAGAPAAAGRPVGEIDPGPQDEAGVPVVAQASPSEPDITAAPAPPATVDTDAPADTGAGWLLARAPERYTLQLVGSRERAAIDRFVARHGLRPPYAVFERSLRGAPWYSLVSGDYPDRDAAVAARSSLPPTLRDSDVWPRSFGSIRASMR